MDELDGLSPFENGYWVWDEQQEGLLFVSRIPIATTASQLNVSPSTKGIKIAQAKQQASHEVRFRDTFDSMDVVTGRRHFQRKCKPGEPEVITIQDIKDVVLFSSNPKDLSPEFIIYFHTPTMDRYLRALIIYFQFFIQVWENMLVRREEAKKKLRQPIVDVLENMVSQDLSDLRSMVAREYMSILLGIDDILPFHHMKNTDNNSLSDKDRRLIETMISVSIRVIWVALQRKNISLIELEMNRMLRTEIFNMVVHRPKRVTTNLDRSPEENRILVGKANILESKLLQRSSLVKELLFGTHDHRMLGIGIAQFQPIDERNEYLEIAFSAPEESLVSLGVTIALLGVPRHEFDALLIARERTSKNFNIPITELFDFQFPPKIKHPDETLPKVFPTAPPRFKESPQTTRSRIQQKKIWSKLIKRVS